MHHILTSFLSYVTWPVTNPAGHTIFFTLFKEALTMKRAVNTLVWALIIERAVKIVIGIAAIGAGWYAITRAGNLW